jgi:hypothetical protein
MPGVGLQMLSIAIHQLIHFNNLIRSAQLGLALESSPKFLLKHNHVPLFYATALTKITIKAQSAYEVEILLRCSCKNAGVLLWRVLLLFTWPWCTCICSLSAVSASCPINSTDPCNCMQSDTYNAAFLEPNYCNIKPIHVHAHVLSSGQVHLVSLQGLLLTLSAISTL